MAQPAPRVSVLLPVYNGEPWLAAAIDSILAQSFRDFELLILDDGSTDASREIAAGYADARIRPESNGRNLGLVATLNRGLDLARGDYIARMDADDLSYPERLERQVAYLDRHPEVGVLGTASDHRSAEAQVAMRPPVEDRWIRLGLTFDAVFTHSTVMLRRDALEAGGLRYDPAYTHAEDYELWVRCARRTRLANLPESLVCYRVHTGNISHRHRAEQVRTADRVRAEYLGDLGLTPSAAELELHLDLIQFRFRGDTDRLRAAGDFWRKLAATAGAALELPEPAIHAELARYWYGAAGRCAGQGPAAFGAFRAYPMGRRADWSWQAKLLARCLLHRPIPEPAP